MKRNMSANGLRKQGRGRGLTHHCGGRKIKFNTGGRVQGARMKFTLN